ncbi:Hypothetical_protein [Hexamita inflata]|uniref:Hypothetical_protein n=1 Tax=Hexamita inflata TaxID=28002 RepID=A0AA86NVK4_9EUKA|nr:Hypothetical protein HINF_LOCUS14091 [Hexamita inflata]
MNHSKCEQQFSLLNKELLELHGQLKKKLKTINFLQNEKVKQVQCSLNETDIKNIQYQVQLEQLNIKYQEENQRLQIAVELQQLEKEKMDKKQIEMENKISYLQMKQVETKEQHHLEMQFVNK